MIGRPSTLAKNDPPLLVRNDPGALRAGLAGGRLHHARRPDRCDDGVWQANVVHVASVGSGSRRTGVWVDDSDAARASRAVERITVVRAQRGANVMVSWSEKAGSAIG